MNVFNVIIGLLFVLLTIQTKLGEKARMLVYRAEDFILGDKNVKEDKQQDQAQQGQQQMKRTTVNQHECKQRTRTQPLSYNGQANQLSHLGT